MRTVRFGDVASRLNIHVDQDNTNLEYYVGGEHIDSREFLITKKAPIKGSTIGYQFQFGFREGDILFMTKNPHLRKCSLVEFDGLCSIATFVIHSNDENILLQKYLLLEMQTDRFWEYCEAHKSGGVNYFITWGTLSNYIFDIPDIDIQKKSADKAWAAYELKLSYRDMIKATDEMLKSQFIEMFGGNKVDYVQLSSLCSTFIDGDWIESKDQSESGIRLIQTGNVGCGEYKDKGDKAKYITEDTFNKLHCTEIYPGDILISRLPDPVGRACVLPEGLGKCVTAVDCTIIRFSEKILPNFFVAYTNTPEYLTQIKSTLAGTTRLRVSRGNLGKVKIPVPSIEQQRTFVSIAEQADKSKFELKQSIEAIDKVIKSLINENL